MGKPGLLVARPPQPRLVGDDVDLHAVELAELTLPEEVAGGADRRGRPVGQRQQEETVFLLGLADQRLEVLGPDAGRLLREDVAAGLQRRVDHRRRNGRLQAHQRHLRLRLAEQLYWSARKMKAAGIRYQHPDWPEDRVNAEVTKIFLHARS